MLLRPQLNTPPARIGGHPETAHHHGQMRSDGWISHLARCGSCSDCSAKFTCVGEDGRLKPMAHTHTHRLAMLFDCPGAALPPLRHPLWSSGDRLNLQELNAVISVGTEPGSTPRGSTPTALESTKDECEFRLAQLSRRLKIEPMWTHYY